MSEPDGDPFALAAEAASMLVDRFGAAPVAAVVLGSGWQDAADALGDPSAEVDVSQLPGFAAPTALGHSPRVRRIDVEGPDGPRVVAVFLGRAHLYEGHSPAVVSHAVRTVAAAGARCVVLTNAAGTLRTDRRVGSPVLISDHLNATGLSPLTGPPPPAPQRGRFVDLTDLYSSRLRDVARSVDPELVDAVYAGLPGPHFETPAEIRMYRAAGAEVLGFSTVLEAIAAHHVGLEVLAISLVSNLCAGMQSEVNDEEVIATGRSAAPRLGALIRSIIGRPEFCSG